MNKSEIEFIEENQQKYSDLVNAESSEYISASYICDNSVMIKVPKEIARIKMCGGALTFIINDTMQFEMPTEEQRENLKKTFGITVELIDD